MGCFFQATGLDAAGFSTSLTAMAKDNLPYPGWDLPVSIKHYFVYVTGGVSWLMTGNCPTPRQHPLAFTPRETR